MLGGFDRMGHRTGRVSGRDDGFNLPAVTLYRLKVFSIASCFCQVSLDSGDSSDTWKAQKPQMAVWWRCSRKVSLDSGNSSDTWKVQKPQMAVWWRCSLKVSLDSGDSSDT